MKNKISWAWRSKKDIAWFLYYFLSGVLTYVVFQTHVIRIILFIAGFEIVYYMINKKFYHFMKRYILNIFYITAYVITAVIYDSFIK